mmetsp:Transcript_5344/g.5506  ORF Transcript_5344/g.5506 Transcript_5344/m.5506 type:complete len:543 (+) Transcript_5344:233-1861(+)
MTYFLQCSHSGMISNFKIIIFCIAAGIFVVLRGHFKASSNIWGSRRLQLTSDKTETSCECYQLQDEALNPNNMLCEFEHVYINNTGFPDSKDNTHTICYTHRAECGLNYIKHISEWTKEKHSVAIDSERRKKNSKQKTISIDKLKIQPIIEHNWNGFSDQTPIQCDMEKINSQSIKEEEFAYYYDFFGMDNYSHALIENFMSLWIILTGIDLSSISTPIILKRHYFKPYANSMAEVLKFIPRSMDGMVITKFKRLLVGSWSLCMHQEPCKRSYTVSQSLLFRDAVMQGVSSVSESKELFAGSVGRPEGDKHGLNCNTLPGNNDRIVLFIDRLDALNRRIVNYKQLYSSILESMHGKRTVCMLSRSEQLSAASQLALYSRAEVIFSVFGGSLGNLIAVSKNTLVIIVRPRAFLPSSDRYARRLLALTHSSLNVHELALQLKHKESNIVLEYANQTHLSKPDCLKDFENECLSHCCYSEVCFRGSDIILPDSAVHAVIKVILHVEQGLPITSIEDVHTNKFSLTLTKEAEYQEALQFTITTTKN